MASRDDIEKFIREAYRRRLTNDVDATCEMFAHDTNFRIAAVRVGPAPLAASGMQEFRPLIENIIKTFELKDFVFKAIVIDDPKVAVHWQARIRSTINGHEALTEVVDMMEVHNGKIASFAEFCDTAMVEHMTGPAPDSRAAVA
jgi:ketosteroid isomerase-like protein